MSATLYPKTSKFLQGRLRHAMSDREKGIVENLIAETQIMSGEELLLQRGDLCHFSTMLMDGFMLRTVHAGDERSIVGFQVPGDFVDLHAFALKRLDHDLMALGRVEIGLVPHDRLEQVMASEPHLARLLWFSTLLDAAIHREWIAKSQQLRAVGRIAHVFAELWYRLRMVDQGSASGFRTPFTQIHLAQMCGISTVHVSRSLHDLRESGIVDFRRGRVTILNADKLKAIGRFDPIYLYGEGDLAVGNALDNTSNTRSE